MKRRKILLLLVIAAVFPILMSCGKPATLVPGISMTSLSYSIGGEPNSQTLSYWITLNNNSQNAMLVEKVTPVLPEALNEFIINHAEYFAVNKTIEPHSYLNVTGEIVLDSATLSKEELASLIQIKEVKIESSFNLKVPGN